MRIVDGELVCDASPNEKIFNQIGKEAIDLLRKMFASTDSGIIGTDLDKAIAAFKSKDSRKLGLILMKIGNSLKGNSGGRSGRKVPASAKKISRLGIKIGALS